MPVSNATAQWNGTLRDGQGVMKPENARDIAFSVGTRFEDQAGSNPEEVLGAALAGCFSMALSLALEQAGSAPKSIRTSAAVTMDRQGWGGSGDTHAPFEILSIELKAEVDAHIDLGKLQQIANDTKKRCPVGKALASVPKISVDVTLVSR